MRKLGIESVEGEIRREKAESLGRTGERLGQALDEVRALRERLIALIEDRVEGAKVDPAVAAEIQAGLKRHTELCALARDTRYQLIVQREAIGFRRHEDVDRQYPIPVSLTLAKLGRVEDPR